MPTKGEGAIGALDYTIEERRELAKKSRTWKCPRCLSENATALPPECESETPSAEAATPQPQPTTTPTTTNTSNNTDNTIKPTVTTPPPSINDNVHNNVNDNIPVQLPQQPVNFNGYQYQPNQFQANMYQPQQLPGNQYMYQANQPQNANQFQQPNQFYPPMNYANQRPPVPDAVRRQQAFLDLIILSLFLIIVALIVNKLTKESDM